MHVLIMLMFVTYFHWTSQFKIEKISKLVASYDKSVFMCCVEVKYVENGKRTTLCIAQLYFPLVEEF